MSDVEVDRAALETAALALRLSVTDYGMHAEDTWRRDTGVGNPAGRTHLRVALEGAVGDLVLHVRTQVTAGLAVGERLAAILNEFTDLDVSLGSGWDRDFTDALA